MQRSSYQPGARIPYSKWARHRADNGLIYLAHPVTGDVKWLWSRHHDPNTSNDYLVNTVTGERQWVTRQNDHLCPITTKPAQSASTTPSKPATASTNPFASTPNSLSKPDVPLVKKHAKPPSTAYREIAAPKSLGLDADEVLMLVPETGRKYIYNKKTKATRWLPHDTPETASTENTAKGFFGRSKTPNFSSPFDDDDENTKEIRDRFSNLGQNSSVRVSDPSISQGVGSAPSSLHGHSLADRDISPPSGNSQTSQHRARQYGHRAGTSTYSPDEAVVVIQCALRSHIVRHANIIGKLRILTNALSDVKNMTATGKYDMRYLRTIPEKDVPVKDVQDAAQRLLELEEYLTQQMLKVDAVESAGNQLVRGKRKLSVKVILGLTDEVDGLRKRLQQK